MIAYSGINLKKRCEITESCRVRTAHQPLKALEGQQLYSRQQQKHEKPLVKRPKMPSPRIIQAGSKLDFVQTYNGRVERKAVKYQTRRRGSNERSTEWIAKDQMSE